MILLDRYLLVQFFKYFFLVLCSLIAVYLLVDFFERIDNFTNAGKPVNLALKYMLLKVPVMYDQLVPVCILLAGIITMGLLNHNHEMMALKAAGICTSRIVRPMLIGALLSIMLTIVMAQWVLPPAISATNKIWYEEIKRQVPRGIDRNGRIYYRGRQGVYTFRKTHAKQTRFNNFIYTVWDSDYQLQKFITANQAIYEDGVWHLHNGQVKQKKTTGNDYDISFFVSETFPLPEKPEDFFIPPYHAKEMSLTDMYERARAGYVQDSNIAWADFHGRLSYIFLGLPLILIGLPIILIAHQKWRHDLSLAVPISSGIAFVAWGWWSASQSMAKAAYLHPAIAAWSIHLLVSGLGIFLIRRQNR